MPKIDPMAQPRILCISLSPIVRDARVLRQISVLREFGDVTTVGYGPSTDGVASHIEVPARLPSLPQTIGGVALLAMRRWRRAELSAPAVAYALAALKDQRFDLVVANDARVLALAHTVAGRAPVWADLHEWAPEERTHILSWRLLVAPLMRHLCATYLPRSTATTTVAESIAELYRRDFGVTPVVMRNSSPYLDLAPRPVEPSHIRLVHSGAAVHGRSLETMIDAVIGLDARYSLDLYLVPGGDAGRYLAKLTARAAGCERIRFRDPVAPAELPRTLNAYDIGVFWIPPTHTNARFTLPNKLFDYVQARLAVAIGPTVEMARVVTAHRLGVVGEGFTVDDCVRALSAFDVDAITAAKAASHAAAHELSFESDARVAKTIIERLLSGAGVHRTGSA